MVENIPSVVNTHPMEECVREFRFTPTIRQLTMNSGEFVAIPAEYLVSNEIKAIIPFVPDKDQEIKSTTREDERKPANAFQYRRTKIVGPIKINS